MNASPSLQPLAAPGLIAEIISLLCQSITDRLRVHAVTSAQVEYIVKRLLEISRRFRGVVARIQAGKIPRERAGGPRGGRELDTGSLGPAMPRGWRRMKAKYDRMERKPQPLWRALGQTRGWLLGLAPQIPRFVWSAPACRARLERVLDDPEMRVLLMASRRVGDSLRPLCWMLGVEFSVLYPAGPVAAVAMADDVSEAPREAAGPAGDAAHSRDVAVAPPFSPDDDPAPAAGLEACHAVDFSKSV
jgi:hypothetical protein